MGVSDRMVYGTERMLGRHWPLLISMASWGPAFGEDDVGPRIRSRAPDNRHGYCWGQGWEQCMTWYWEAVLHAFLRLLFKCV